MLSHSKLASSCVTLLLAACAGPPRVEVPETLKPAANESLAMVVAARGVQIYECRARQGAADGHDWVFVAPEAELFDAQGRSIGRHGAGPFWEALDGSRIVGTLKSRADAPIAKAIPWLLLTVKSTGAEGAFSKVTSVQRVNTRGGAAPGFGCMPETTGTTVRVHYQAEYYFFGIRPRPTTAFSLSDRGRLSPFHFLAARQLGL
jgi:hypothetical protein